MPAAATDTVTQAAPIAAPVAATLPASAIGSAAVPNAAGPAQTVAAAESTSTAALSAPAHAAPAASGRWSLVLGSFVAHQQAEQARVRWKSLRPRLSEAAGVDRIYYRVLSGDYANRAAAEAALTKLRRNKEFKDAWALQLP